MKNKIIKLSFIALSIYAIFLFCEKETDGFTIARITSRFSFHPEWETDPLTKEGLQEVELALSQKFHYLGRGGQCYVFDSEDGQYVIKFFKYHRVLPLSSSLKRNTKKLVRDFSSCKLAFEKLKDETGVVFLHLNKTKNLQKKLTIFDKLNIAHVLDLDNYEFIVQKKAVLLHPHIHMLMKNQDIEGAKKAIDAILDLIISRCKKGIHDEDPGLHKNIGFLRDKALIIDIGRFVVDTQRTSPEVYNRDLISITERFGEWLSKHYPELNSYLAEKLPLE